jgi:hypothetical protein
VGYTLRWIVWIENDVCDTWDLEAGCAGAVGGQAGGAAVAADWKDESK